MKMSNNIRKILLATLLSLTMGLTACTAKDHENLDSETETTEVEPKKELTPLEKEISELKDFQMTNKVYDNKDLEPFNKMQGYLYSIKEVNVGEDLELIELIPPTKKGMSELEKDGDEYEFIGNVIIPCYFIYLEAYDEWAKYYPRLMNETEFWKYDRANNEYFYATPEELEETFSVRERSQAVQYKLAK